MTHTRQLPSRRQLLRYVGAGAASAAAGSLLAPLARSAAAPTASVHKPWLPSDAKPPWVPVLYPLPIPGDGATALADAVRLAQYTVVDDLLLPEGFRYDVLVQWGEELGPQERPDQRIRVGFNADYTGLLPIKDAPNEYWLIVNHEYISGRPWFQAYPAIYGRDLITSLLDALKPADKVPPKPAPAKPSEIWRDLTIDFQDPDEVARTDTKVLEAARAICQAALSELGVSILRVRRDSDGGFSVIKDSPDHRRFCGNFAQNVARHDAFAFTGPAAALLGSPIGTMHNCSGATTPWGTFLSCEENYQDSFPDFTSPDGDLLPTSRAPFHGILSSPGENHPTDLPFELRGIGTGADPAPDPRHYGWVCEIDPVAGTLRKHTALGRFRHENVALRCEAGKKLVAYMGDDRRGGHLWKFVSHQEVADPADPENRRLLESGTLYVAQLAPNFTGRWIPLIPQTPLQRPEPRHCADGFIMLPRRPAGGQVAIGAAEKAELNLYYWTKSIEKFTGKPFAHITLADLVRPPLTAGDSPITAQSLLLLEAHLMANSAGGMPTSRPEDIEIHPVDRSVYIAFTDSTGADEGSPDSRIFPDSKKKNSRQYGAIYRIVEDAADPAADTFTWGRFVSSGEAAEGGGGFACADNLAFDPQANLWMVCDITTPAHNFPVGNRDPQNPKSTPPGSKNFMGVFGNNAMFAIPTSGPAAGIPHCFAIGPMECELTGPTFTDDGAALLLSVQHPGELHGARAHKDVNQPAELTRDFMLAARDGALFQQKRTVPLGSNFPSKQPGTPPRPCVVCIRRA